MTDRRDSNVGDEHEARRLDELVGGGRTVAMVMTMIDGAHTSRPVTCVEVGTGRMSFLVSREVEWVADIAAGRATVHVTVADQKDNTYVSLEGTAGVASDVAEMERLWTPVAKVWFDGPHDPSLAVLHFDVSRGQYWDGPSGSLRQGVNIVRAMIEGDDALLGTSGPVSTA